MRAYLVKTSGVDPVRRKFAGSQSEAAQFKKDIQEAHDLKRTQVGVESIEIPTAKSELIPWINKNLVG